MIPQEKKNFEQFFKTFLKCFLSTSVSKYTMKRIVHRAFKKYDGPNVPHLMPVLARHIIASRCILRLLEALDSDVALETNLIDRKSREYGII